METTMEQMHQSLLDTMKGTVDSGEEKTIMDGYDLMMVEKDGAYYVLG